MYGWTFNLPTSEDLETHITELQLLDTIEETDVYAIWKTTDEDLEFADGKAVNLVYDNSTSLAGKMIFRFRSAADICFFWNSIDVNNRARLLRYAKFEYDLQLDFFVWLGNNHCQWDHMKLVKTTIAVYLEAEEATKRQWLEAYTVEMRDTFGVK
jgi:hypothetical protein